MTRAAWSAVSLCVALIAAGHARAADDVDTQLMRFARERGASDVSVVERRFLVEGQAHAWPQATTQRGCVGFLVIGRGEVRDVDVALYTPSGLPLDEDLTAAPYAYVRACTDANVPLVLGANVYAGRGELTVFRVESAPRELGRLPDSIPLAVMAGGAFETPQAVGDAPDDAGVVAMLTSEEERMSSLGYVAIGPPDVLDLREGVGLASTPWLAGHCYRVVAHGPGLRALTMDVLGESSTGALRREPAREVATLSYCALRSGLHQIRVRSASARGVALLRVFEHPFAAPDVDPEISFGVAEIGALFAQRGFAVEHLGDAWVQSRDPSRFTTTLTAGQCYGAAAASAQGSPLDLRVIDPNGHLLSRTEGRTGVPIVYVCASESGVHQVVLGGRGRDQRVAVWLGVQRSLPRGVVAR